MYNITYPAVVCPNAGFPNENVESWLLKSELVDVTAEVVSGAPKVDVWEKNPPDVEKLGAEVDCPKSDVWVTETVAGWPKGVLCTEVVEGWANKFVCGAVVGGVWPKRDGWDTAAVVVGWPKSDGCDTVVIVVDWPKRDGCDTVVVVDCPKSDGCDTVEMDGGAKVVTWFIDVDCCPKEDWVVEVPLEIEASDFGVVKKVGVSGCDFPVNSEDVVDWLDWHVLGISEEAVETTCPNRAADEEVSEGSTVGGGEGGLEIDKFDEVLVSILVTDERIEVVVEEVILTTESIFKVGDEFFKGSGGVPDEEIGCFNSLELELITFDSVLASDELSVLTQRLISSWLGKVPELLADFNESTSELCSWVDADGVTPETVLLSEPKLRLRVSPRKLDFEVLSSFFVCCSILLDPKKNPVLFFRGKETEELLLSWVLEESFVSVVISKGVDAEVFATDTTGLEL